MAWWNESTEGSKRLALWLVAAVTPILLVVELLAPRPSRGWHYVSLAVWAFAFLNAAYRLVTERAARS